MRSLLILALLGSAKSELEACGITLGRAAPVRWEPCAFAEGCRQMATDWPASERLKPYRITASAAAEVNADGSVTLMFGRVTTNGTWKLVADADGPVRFAALETSERCALGLPSISEGGRFVWRLYDSEVQGRLSEYGGAALTGPKLDVVARGSRAAGRRFTVTHRAVVELEPEVAALREVNGVRFSQQHRPGEPVRLRAGERELVSGAADFGSDGRTMAWAELRGRGVLLATAPFATVPEKLQRRVLATVPTFGFGVWPFAVSKNHAARLSAEGVQVFDLETGAHQLLEAPKGVTYRELLAITEHEIFVMADVTQVPTLLRLTLKRPLSPRRGEGQGEGRARIELETTK